MSYRLIHHENGSASVACATVGEVMHPTVGPEIEARALYVEGLRLTRPRNERLVVWDVGMGAAANALATIDALRESQYPTRIVSFDHTDQALRFALENSPSFPTLARHTVAVTELLNRRFTRIGPVDWTFVETDFPEWLAGDHPAPAPHAVLFDAWSPKSNPAMWTLPVFERLRKRAAETAALATYSRATCVRSALLLAGFFVGRGPAIGVKEETTLAATDFELLANPLPPEWLLKAERSHSGRPLPPDRFEQAFLTPEQLRRLREHPQFR